jgi:hypothetical protein
MRQSSFVILFLCLLLPATGFTQSSNRWLLVFDTSFAMRDRAKAVQDVTMDLFATGMHGNMRAGDTIGVWTFNDKLHPGAIPLQIWSPETSQALARGMMQFLSGQSYENTAQLDEVTTNINRIVKMSDVITIILVSDGSQPIKGTPFDAPINAFYKANFRQQKKEQMPVVTVFRGLRGTLATNTLNLCPWPVDIPTVPAPPVAQEKPKPAPVPPLIMIGKKPEAAKPPNAPVSEMPPAPAPQTNAVESAATPAVAIQNNTAPKAEVPAPAPVPQAVAPEEKPKPSEPIIANTPPPVPIGPPPVQISETPQPVQKSEAVQNTEPQPAPVVSQPAAKPPAPEQPPAETATSVPSQGLFSARNIAIVSAAFTVIVCGLLILSARRARRSHVSLITRSLDRDQK